MRGSSAATIALLAIAGLFGITREAYAQMGAPSGTVTDQSGEGIYNHICVVCHLDHGRGAIGAGSYPALAKNPKLAEAGYPVAVVLHGLNSMPAFGTILSDQQVANLVNYLRSHMGNNYKDSVSVAQVKTAR